MSPTIRGILRAGLPRITAIGAHHVMHGRAGFELAPPGCSPRWRWRRGLMLPALGRGAACAPERIAA
ncbi:hypothetical protein [Falsiroseomonas sp.]|uniref:hypothetical protein n=1 Tax=Falsiroseomonas sp. TaxID=2870721 RepID=UPI003F6F9495